MRPIHGSQTNKTTETMDKRTLDYINELILDEERSAVKQVLYEVNDEVRERNVVRSKLLYSDTAIQLFKHMSGLRFEIVYKLRRNLFHRNLEAFEILSILANKIESIH